MRRFARYLLLGLLLLCVAMLSAVTAMRFAIHGREVHVPKVVGLPLEGAQARADAAGLRLSVEDRFFSSEIREGAIVSQSPVSGVRVRRGGKLRVAQSLGPSRASIPDVVGQTPRGAQLNIERRGLRVGSIGIVRIPGAPPGQVIAQSPPPNSPSVQQPKVDLLISADEPAVDFLMPNFVTRRLADVAREIEAAGLQLAVRKNAPQNGLITAQHPPPGRRIAAGATIRLEVAQ